MENQVSMGMNRTGGQMAPGDIEDVEAFAKSRLGEGRRDGEAVAALHADYIHHAERLGSVPMPGTIKGVASAVTSTVKGENPSVLVDKMGERLAFERTGIRLYEALITKWSALSEEVRGSEIQIDEAQLRSILADEEAHFRLLTDAIKTMGADPTAMTPGADIAGISAAGWLQVINDPRTTISQALNTMLSAELTDDAGWELLADLAASTGHTELVERFTSAEQAEHRHIERIKGWLRESVLGQPS